MTIFGIIWIALLLFFVVKQDLEKILFMTLLSSVFQCNNVIILNGVGVGPFIITSLVFLLYYMFLIRKKFLISRKIDFIAISSFLIFAVVMISILFNLDNFNVKNISRVFQLLVYILCFLSIRRLFEFRKFDYNKMLKTIIDFVLIIGIIQFACSIGLIPKNIFFQTFLYNDLYNESIAYYATSKIRLYSTFMEPSYCAAFLLFAFCFSMTHFSNSKHNVFRILLIILEIALTFSTTAYVGFAISVTILFLFTNNKKKLLRLLPLFIIGIILLGVLGYLDTVIINKSSTASATTREIWNRVSLSNFISSPIYGVGYKTSRASSLIYQIIGEMGIIGISSYVIFVWVIFKKIFSKNVDKGIVAALISIICCQFMSIPDLDFCVFWFMMYVFGMYFYKNLNTKINE